MKNFFIHFWMFLMLITATSSFCFGENKLSLINYSIVHIPIVINIDAEIQGVNILAKFDDTMIEYEGIDLAGGIFDLNQTDFNVHSLIKVFRGNLTIKIYTFGSEKIINKGEGKLFDITFKGMGQIGQSSSFNINEIICTNYNINEMIFTNYRSCGGINFKGKITQKLDLLTIEPACSICFDNTIGMSEIIYSLNVLSGIKHDSLYCEISLENLICMQRVLIDMRRKN
ncbi:secreted protein [Candidatus Magnetomorum sp. HK-1]|nr:secreted protein [Candidatus Magnetomorum sp. HK-1]